MAKPARVLYFINDLFGGGAQKGLINLLEAGFFKGAELHVATIIRGDGCVEAELLKHLPAANLHRFTRAERMQLKHLLWAFIRYPLLLLKLRPRVTILSLPQANIVGRFWGHLLPVTRLFAFEHNIAYARKGYAAILRALSLSVMGIITDTNKTGEETTRFFLPFRRYKLIELPLYTGSVAHAHLKTSHKLANPPHLMIAGRLSAAKNHTGLLTAMAILKGQGTSFHLSIIGSGELESSLKAHAASLGLADDVTFRGYLTPWTAECPDADIYLQPSFREGLCITVVEAMRHGLPVIASPRGGMLDYGIDGENMLYTDPENPADIAAKVTLLLKDARLRSKLAANAIRTMEDRFGSEAIQLKLAQSRKVLGF